MNLSQIRAAGPGQSLLTPELMSEPRQEKPGSRVRGQLSGGVLSIVIFFNDYPNNDHTIQFKYILLSTAV
jgi:hypothetical protein